MALRLLFVTMFARCQRNWRRLLCPAVLGMMTASSACADAAITFTCCAYTPNNVTINAGESVSWTGDFGLHPLRQVDGPNSDTPVPGGFSSSTGTFLSVPFSTPGTYYFQCTSHGLAQFGGTMRGHITVLSPPAVLDIDGNGTTDALTDGLIVIRYLFGLTGTALTTGALGGTPTRTDPIVIKAYLDGIRAALDIDGNGTSDALTDGLLLLRYLFGLRGASLLAGAVDPLAMRTTALAIEAYILSLTQ